jgi:hypothetical protein
MDVRETRNLQAGDVVEVLSAAEILTTLDSKGQTDGLPFMPEMLQYCGRRFRVYKSAHKTCDFVTRTGIRRLSDTVHLEGLRCDGSAHGGCQADCLLYWKEAWVKRVSAADCEVHPVSIGPHTATVSATTSAEAVLWRAATRSEGTQESTDPAYVCQATELPRFTRPLSPWDPRPYVRDYRSGNVTLGVMLRGLVYRAFDNLVNLGVGWGPVLRNVYDRVQRLRGGIPYPALPGTIPAGARTPTLGLNLQPGEYVRVKDYRAILETLDTNCKNRGMAFSAEMVPYCGGVFRVRGRVDRLIDEVSGRMIDMKTGAVILEGAVCQARYNKKLLFCPRATFAYWREIWLERVEAPAAGFVGASSSSIGTLVTPLADCGPGTSMACASHADARGR